MTKLEKIQMAQDKTAKMKHGLETVQENLDKAEKVAASKTQHGLEALQDNLDKAEMAAEVEEFDECSGGVVLGIAAAVTLAALAVGVVIIIRKRRNKQEDENEDWAT